MTLMKIFTNRTNNRMPASHSRAACNQDSKHKEGVIGRPEPIAGLVTGAVINL